MSVNAFNMNNPFGIAGSASAPTTTIEKQVVEQRQAEVKTQQTQQASPQQPASFGEAATAYINHRDQQAAKAKANGKQANVLNQVAQQLGKSPAEVTPKDIEKFFQKQAHEQGQLNQQQSFHALSPHNPQEHMGEMVAALLNLFEELNADSEDSIHDVEVITVGEDISDDEKLAIEKFLQENDLNEYGDPIDTDYKKKPPTYNPKTGEYVSRYTLLTEKFADRPWR